MEKKLSQLRNCFRQESCKYCADRCEQLETDPIKKAMIIDAEVHKDLLSDDNQCSQHNCWECSNVLC